MVHSEYEKKRILYGNLKAAEARQLACEKLGWPLALLGATAIHLKWDSWIFTIPSAVLFYWLCVRGTDDASRQAFDAWDNYPFECAGDYVPPGGYDSQAQIDTTK